MADSAWPISTGASVGMGLTFGALIAIGLTGNSLVCVAICVHKKLRKKENLYFVSLAVADLLLCVLVMPFAAYNDAVGLWPFGEYCKFWMSLDIMCCTCSILHLCAISFDRYYHIHFPMQYGQRMTGRKIVSAIFIVWTLSATIAFAPLAFETHFDRALSVHSTVKKNWTAVQKGPPAEQSVTTDSSSIYYRCNFNLDPCYAIISSIVSFYIPSCVMIVAYTKLYQYARKHAKSIRHQLRTATTFLMNVAGSTPVNKTEVKKRWSVLGGYHSSISTAAKKREIGASDSKARITLGVILGFFIFSWGPFFVLNIAKSFCVNSCIPHSLFVVLTWMGYANSAQNPIIYSIFNRDFRQAFSKILLCGKETRKQPPIAANDDSLVIENGCSRQERNPSNVIARRLSYLSCSNHVIEGRN